MPGMVVMADEELEDESPNRQEETASSDGNGAAGEESGEKRGSIIN